MLALKKHIDRYKIQSRKLLKSPLAISFVFWGIVKYGSLDADGHERQR